MKKNNIYEYMIPKQKSEKWIIVLCVLIYLIFMLLPTAFIIIMFILSINSADFKIVNDKVIVGNGDFHIVNISSFPSEEEYVINGYIENIDDDLDYLEITFELYDSNNTVIGEIYANLYDLDKNRRYKFHSIYNNYDAYEVVKYSIKDINYY